MIRDFIASWPLFHDAYVAGWLIAVLLAVVGVLVVARNQIFLGAAVAQTSTLGIALGMWLGSALGVEALAGDHAHGALSLIGVGFAVLAALLTARGGSGAQEAATGWLFLAAASGATLVLAASPHGLEEIKHLVSSSIIGATANDVWLFAALALISIGGVVLTRDRLLLFAIDPSMAVAVGMRASVWNAAVAAWLGLVVGLATRATGLLYTFGCLVLPPLAAASLCRESAALFWVAPLLAVASGLAGFVVANHLDLPPAQMAVALQALVVGAAWGVGRRAR